MTVVARPTVSRGQLLIGGAWVDSVAGEQLDVVDPSTDKVLTTIQAADGRDVDRAVVAARTALEEGAWPRMHASERGRLLHRLAQLVMDNADELAVLESVDVGKPIRETRAWDLPAVIDCFSYYAGWADKIHGETIPVKGSILNYTLREPVGVVAQIVPWNFPLMLAAWKLAPALACGCVCILKPSRESSLTALRLGELILEAGFPPGVVNIITGAGTAAGNSLVEHPGVDKIAFTGNTATGASIMRAASQTMKRVSFELGSKSPSLIFADADIDAAVHMSARGSFFNQGEVCSACTRVLVHESVLDHVQEGLILAAKSLKVGDPLDPETRMGSIVSRTQFDTILKYVDTGLAEGARLVAGGHRIGHSGNFMEPTVFAGVTNRMTIAQDEIFGPVATLIPFSDEDEAVALANQTRYGLAAAVWTRDVARAHRVARRLQAGTVWVNTYGPTDTRSMWGGFKASGIGRELGHFALDLYTEVKSIWVSTD